MADQRHCGHRRDFRRGRCAAQHDGHSHPRSRSLRKVLGKHLAHIVKIEFEIRSIAINGDVLVLERVDHITTPLGLHSLPVVGVIELRDGLIQAWREYFDSAQAASALAASKAGDPA